MQDLPSKSGKEGCSKMIDFDAQIRLVDLRTRAAAGERISANEMRELILDLQRGREVSAAKAAADRRTAKKASGPKTPKPAIDINSLFGGSQ